MNISDYIDWRGDLTFDAAPFCEVDNLIFSVLSYNDFSAAVPDYLLGNPVRLSSAADKMKDSVPEVLSLSREKYLELLLKATGSRRFSGVYATFYVSETSREDTMQFAAVTFVLPDNSIFVSYRGTDASVVGWKENFELSFSDATMAQKRAAEYLRSAASFFKGDIRVGGHSKGGNLAYYAAMNVPDEVSRRIKEAYCNDGPGFIETVSGSERFKAVSDRFRTFMPQSSLVGTLLERHEEYRIVESSEKGGIAQHDPFSWQVRGPSFVYLDDLSREGRKNEQVFESFISSLSKDERKSLTSSIFEIVESTGAERISDLSHDVFAKIASAAKAYGSLSPETRETVISSLKRLVSAVLK